jgi:sulfur-oxidizing protein SoxZ
MARVKPRVKVPDTAAAGEVVTIKTLISHPMETGQRKNADGTPIPRQIINAFKATFNGELVIAIDLRPSISANPFFEFEMRVPESGVVAFEWVDDDGSVYTEEAEIAVV